MTTRFFITLALTFICTITFADDKKQTDAVTHVNAGAAEKLVKENKVAVLDVRTADEYTEGHIAGSKNVDFTSNEFAQELEKLDKSKPYLVHCASGKRSTSSLKIFEKLGFKNLFHLDGGFNAWKEAGKPVEK